MGQASGAFADKQAELRLFLKSLQRQEHVAQMSRWDTVLTKLKALGEEEDLRLLIEDENRERQWHKIIVAEEDLKFVLDWRQGSR